jgi:anti-sigma factor ChrR (cupin superfamily)
MEYNSDFTKRVSVHSAGIPWVASPMAGVDRRMLDRVGGEVARATTIVRYAPKSQFSPHVHGGGEEFLVLEGVFQDEHGDFPAGSYIRNPPTTSHKPGSEPGCIIFVKLWQFEMTDRDQIRIDTSKLTFTPVNDRLGVETMPLFHDTVEDVRLERWAPGVTIDLALAAGGEFLVMNGTFVEAGETFKEHSWLRLPPGARLKATVGAQGCKVWVKTGHLTTRVDGPAAPDGLLMANS